MGCGTRVIVTLSCAMLIASRAEGQRLEQAELLRRLGAHLDSASANGSFSGVVLIARNGEPIFERAYGLADRSTGRANQTTTAFNIGSINKTFTSTAIRQLAAAGKIQLDSTLAYHWPDYPNAEVARRVTIRQLLSHRSGIGGNIFGVWEGGTRGMIRGNADYLRLFVHEPLQFEPGARSAYSNAGYIVLGELVTRLSGEDYYTYVARHIYAPAGMQRTGHFAKDSLPPNTAIGYVRRGSDLVANTEQLPGRGSSAGGGYSTAQDLLRYVNALREQRIPSGPPAGIGIAGGAGGLNGAVDGDLPGGYDVIVLANLDPPAAERIARLVRTWLGAED